MSDSTRGLRLIVVAALILGIIAALGAGAAPEAGSGGGLKVATVDTNALLNKYNGTEASNSALRKKYEDYQTVFQTWKQNPLLAETDQKRLGELVVKEANLNEPEKAEKKKLLDQSAALFAEFTSLQTKANPAPADKDRITALTKLAGDTDNRIQQGTKDADDELQKMQKDNMTLVLRDLRKGVATVAQKKGINIVLSNDTAWYAETDITDDVLKTVNGK
jgi:Skp family chaperone for outer membrane proteins